MGPKIFGIDIQGEIASAMPAQDMVQFVLRRVPNATLDPNNLTGAPISGQPAEYPCHGFIKSLTKDQIFDAALAETGSKMITLIAKPLADVGIEPTTNDLIIDGAITYTIVRVIGNSAKAVWKCFCRG